MKHPTLTPLEEALCAVAAAPVALIAIGLLYGAAELLASLGVMQ